MISTFSLHGSCYTFISFLYACFNRYIFFHRKLSWQVHIMGHSKEMATQGIQFCFACKFLFAVETQLWKTSTLKWKSAKDWIKMSFYCTVPFFFFFIFCSWKKTWRKLKKKKKLIAFLAFPILSRRIMLLSHVILNEWWY